MRYSELSISLLLEKLQTQSLQDKTPKKYSVPMFEAWEVIQQLQKEIERLQNQQLTADSPTTSKEAIAWSERRIPLPPLQDSLADRACPNCNSYISWDALNDAIQDAPAHCKHCGQAFDWSREPKYTNPYI